MASSGEHLPERRRDYGQGRRVAAERRYRDHCVELLRQSGARVTRSRLAVIECLEEAPRSLSPRAILAMIRGDRRLPDVNLVTIYRTLATLGGLGLVHRLGPSGEFVGCAQLACAGGQHILTRCAACGSATELELPGEVLAPLLGYLQRARSFEPGEHFLQLNGLCRQCHAQSLRDRA